MGEKVLCLAARQTAAVALLANINEPLHDKTNKVACAPSEDSDQPGHPPSANINEPLHDKTNKVACEPSEDTDQPGHLPSLISLRCPHEESLGP